MPTQIVREPDLAKVIRRWAKETKLSDSDRFEIHAEQDVLVIKRPPKKTVPSKKAASSKSAVLETEGTMDLPVETVHEIALNPEILFS